MRKLIEALKSWYKYHFVKEPGNAWTAAERDSIARYVVKGIKSGKKPSEKSLRLAKTIFENLHPKQG